MRTIIANLSAELEIFGILSQISENGLRNIAANHINGCIDNFGLFRAQDNVEVFENPAPEIVNRVGPFIEPMVGFTLYTLGRSKGKTILTTDEAETLVEKAGCATLPSDDTRSIVVSETEGTGLHETAVAVREEI